MNKQRKALTKEGDGTVPVAIIERRKGLRIFDFAEIWNYRELLWVLVERDLRVRYKQTVLGVGWVIIQPLLLMAIFSVVFGRLAKIPSDGIPYPLFVFAALLPWLFFASCITTCSNSLVGQQHLIAKVYFPRLIVPFSSVGAGLMDFAISTLLMFALMIYFGVEWTMQLLIAPLLVVAVIFLALGVGTLLAALTVTYRDFRFVTPFLVQIWMFLTPVIYPVSIFPERWQWVLYLNPMTGIVDGFRAAFLGQPFSAFGLATSGITCGLLFLIGVYYFARVERRFADII